MRSRRIYFDIDTGEIIKNTGETDNPLALTPSIDKEISIFSVLSERNRDTFDVLELSYGEFAQDFAIAKGCRVDVETKVLKFQYHDGNEPEIEQPYIAPLSKEVETLKMDSMVTMTAIAEVYEETAIASSDSMNALVGLSEVFEYILELEDRIRFLEDKELV